MKIILSEHLKKRLFSTRALDVEVYSMSALVVVKNIIKLFHFQSFRMTSLKSNEKLLKMSQLNSLTLKPVGVGEGERG